MVYKLSPPSGAIHPAYKSTSYIPPKGAITDTYTEYTLHRENAREEGRECTMKLLHLLTITTFVNHKMKSSGQKGSRSIPMIFYGPINVGQANVAVEVLELSYALSSEPLLLYD